MSTQLVVARARLRLLLREPTANKWSDAELSQYIQDADWAVTKKVGKVRNAGFSQLVETVTLPANASTFSLVVGTNPTALTKMLRAIIFIEHQNTAGTWVPCGELQEGSEWRYRGENALVSTADTTPLYRLRRPNIVFLPASAAARTLRISYRELRVPYPDDASLLEVEDDYVPMVLYRAGIEAMAKLGEQETQWESILAAREDEMYEDLARASGEASSQGIKSVESAALFNF